MGADLITYLLKGPAKITQAKRKAALKAIDIFLAAGADLVSAYDTIKLFERKDKGWEEITEKDLKRCETVIEELTNTRGSVLADFCEDHGEHLDTIVDSFRDDMESFNPEEFVDEFISWWEKGGGRDTNSRPDPDDMKKRIVVCGDMSWGDAPEGYGYTLCRKAYWFNIPQVLGIH